MTDPTQPQLPQQVVEGIKAKHGAPSRPWWREPVLWVTFCVVAAMSVGLFLWVNSTVGDAQRDARANAAGLAQANDKLRSLGAAPVSTPAPVPVPTVTKTVTTAPQPPSRAAIADAVESYCAQTVCGKGPTASQVAQAVATFCSVDGRCRGPAGPAGPGGASGASGEPGVSGAAGASGAEGAPGAPGPAGPTGAAGQNATSDQVAAAVAAYCAEHNQCQGPPGQDGHNGGGGRDGQPPVSWTYTDALGVRHSCVRTDPFDPDAPTYTCN